MYAAPCGVYCKVCPSYEKSCWGCRSEKPQKRISKKSCPLRLCTSRKKIKFCVECNVFPCKTYTSRLLSTHTKDARYQYRRDAAFDMKLILTEGIRVWDKYQHEKWTCPHCNGQIIFYSYQCENCHKLCFPD